MFSVLSKLGESSAKFVRILEQVKTLEALICSLILPNVLLGF